MMKPPKKIVRTTRRTNRHPRITEQRTSLQRVVDSRFHTMNNEFAPLPLRAVWSVIDEEPQPEGKKKRRSEP